MIEFNYETEFTLSNQEKITSWIENCISNEGFELGEINYIFCDDTYLHKLNVEFLNHDTLTDIISFDNTLGKIVNGDVFISIERVKDNALLFQTTFDEELHRVMIHGVLHYVGYKDKSEAEKEAMRNKENQYLLKLKA